MYTARLVMCLEFVRCGIRDGQGGTLLLCCKDNVVDIIYNRGVSF